MLNNIIDMEFQHSKIVHWNRRINYQFKSLHARIDHQLLDDNNLFNI